MLQTCVWHSGGLANTAFLVHRAPPQICAPPPAAALFAMTGIWSAEKGLRLPREAKDFKITP